MSLAAISPASFTVSITSSVLRVTYRLAAGQVSVWACSLVMGVLSSVVLVRRCLRPRTAARGDLLEPAAT